MSTENNQRNVTISHQHDKISIPVIESSEGPCGLDIRTIYPKHKMFTYDPGFMATASCKSKITYIDGAKGILRYRGYPIEELAEKSNFLEVSYLLLFGELPNKKKYEEFEYNIKHHTMVQEQVQFLLRGFPRKSHPMSIMVGAVAHFLRSIMNKQISCQKLTELILAIN